MRPKTYTERPILFSAPMVLAILDGSKTQTRRNVKGEITNTEGAWLLNGQPMQDCPAVVGQCPYGQPGDRLWVRETWSYYGGDEYLYQQEPASVGYRADHVGDHLLGGRWRPSIYMPRWASRITLDITGVRLERAQDITRGDAMAEGCPFQNMANGPDPRAWFAETWVAINGADSWESNPWVWAIEFKRAS